MLRTELSALPGAVGCGWHESIHCIWILVPQVVWLSSSHCNWPLIAVGYRNTRHFDSHISKNVWCHWVPLLFICIDKLSGGWALCPSLKIWAKKKKTKSMKTFSMKKAIQQSREHLLTPAFRADTNLRCVVRLYCPHPRPSYLSTGNGWAGRDC